MSSLSKDVSGYLPHVSWSYHSVENTAICNKRNEIKYSWPATKTVLQGDSSKLKNTINERLVK